ncbi:hypothetical protein PIB30_091437 [Stylosanthes scabra]|uniref:Multiple myeloma tumor-associated protein 2-like N-terminal domain-containing protein n=1 Tax=Stylosanthes scabra TaxID=79078 RepID=A0ABU6UV99_9FABA|nr:hypothetical protein [Stylosanthes scabra]
MYHPTRGGVRGGRDQFSWEDVKADKHRENYLGHSIKAPVGRWQKGKDLHWYTRDKKSQEAEMEAAKEEIKRIKEEEEQAMREALGLAPKRANRSHGNRLDKHEFSELVKRGSTAEDLGEGHAEAARVQGLGFARAPRPWEEPGSSTLGATDSAPSKVENVPLPNQSATKTEEDSEDESRRKRRCEERKEEKREKLEKRRSREDRKHEKHEKREKRERHRDSDDRKRHKKDKERRRHDSDSE